MNLPNAKSLESLTKKELLKLVQNQDVQITDLTDSVAASDMISWVYDIGTQKLIIGKGTTKLLGDKEGTELSFEELKDRVHPEDKELMELNFMSYIDKYPNSHEYYIRIFDYKNNYRWIASKGTLFRDEIGVAYKIAGTLRDISDRKKIEDRNVVSETRYHLLSQYAKEGIIIYNKQNVITDLNIAAEKIFEYDRNEIIGLNLENILDRKTMSLIEKSKNKGEYVDFHGVKKNGESIFLELLNKENPAGIGIFIVNDIHQRKLAENELRNNKLELEKIVAERTAKIQEQNDELDEQRRTFESFLENLQGMAYQYRPKGKDWETTFVSKGALDLTGYQANEFLEGALRVDKDLVAADINNDVWKEITNSLKKKTSFHVQYPIKTKTGGEKWVLDRGTGVYDIKGKLISLEGVMLDITREKLQEEKLLHAQDEITYQNKIIKQREKSYSALLTNLQGMAYRVLNDLTTVTYISEGCLPLTGYTQKEIIEGNKFFEKRIVRDDHQKSVGKIINRALKNKESYEVSYPIICKDGTEKWVSERGIGVYNNSGKLESLEGMIIDITKSKNLERQLLLAQETMDKAPVIIEWVTSDGSFAYVNEEAIRVSGFTREEFAKQKVYEMDPTLNAEIWNIIFEERSKNKAKDLETIYTTKDGKKIPVLINAFNMKYEGIPYNIAFMNDISRLKYIEGELKEINNELTASEEELRQQSEELKSLNENLEIQKIELENTVYKLNNTRDQLIHTEKMASLGVLVAGIAHELNNPIGYLKTSSEALNLLLEDLKNELTNLANHDIDSISELSKDFDTMASHIQSGAEQAAEIVKGLRIFSRMDKEKTEKHDIHHTLDNVLLMLHNSYKYGVNIHKDYKKIPPIECAPGQINQVFLNLINNAIQALDGEGDVWISTEEIDDRVLVTVKDNGPGISKELQSRIFEPFFTTKEPGEGTGLGLSISLGIIQDHNGSIDFKSDKNGTCFIVSLPKEQ